MLPAEKLKYKTVKGVKYVLSPYRENYGEGEDIWYEIDPATGLPKVGKNMYWSITPGEEYSEYNYITLYNGWTWNWAEPEKTTGHLWWKKTIPAQQKTETNESKVGDFLIAKQRMTDNEILAAACYVMFESNPTKLQQTPEGMAKMGTYPPRALDDFTLED